MRFVTFCATAGGAGLSPLAPGTCGTFVGLVLLFFCGSMSLGLSILLICITLLVGTWSAARFDEFHKTQDNQCIVIDEVLGMQIAALGMHGWELVPAFVAFRFFDILKLPPARQVDTWSKKQNNIWLRGFGVMADDIVAAIQALCLCECIRYLIRGMIGT